MSTEPETTEHRVTLDASAPPIMLGAQVADAVLPLAAQVATNGLEPAQRAEFWHGFMAAVTAAMGAQVGLVQSEGIMAACIGYGRRMAAEEAERAKGAH